MSLFPLATCESDVFESGVAVVRPSVALCRDLVECERLRQGRLVALEIRRDAFEEGLDVVELGVG